MSAAAASRDITLVSLTHTLTSLYLIVTFIKYYNPFFCVHWAQFHAMDTLHRHNYDLSSALSVLVPAGGPVLCRDEMEEWSASEAAMFEEALEKYGKDFNDIRQDFVSVCSLMRSHSGLFNGLSVTCNRKLP